MITATTCRAPFNNACVAVSWISFACLHRQSTPTADVVRVFTCNAPPRWRVVRGGLD